MCTIEIQAVSGGFPLHFGPFFVLFSPVVPETLAKHCDCAGGRHALNQSTAAKDKQIPEPKEFWVCFFFVRSPTLRNLARQGNQQSAQWTVTCMPVQLGDRGCLLHRPLLIDNIAAMPCRSTVQILYKKFKRHQVSESFFLTWLMSQLYTVVSYIEVPVEGASGRFEPQPASACPAGM